MTVAVPVADPPGERVWWRPAGEALVWADDLELNAVFDPASGETHLLGELPALILRHVDLVPRTVPELCAEISGEPPELCDPGVLDHLNVALESLAGAELVESRTREIP